MRNTRHNKQNETQNEMKRNEMSQKSEIEIKKQLNFFALWDRYSKYKYIRN